MKHNRIIASLTLFSLFQTGTEAQENTRPNIIFVMTDDQGKNDLGCEGNSYIHTPHIDAFYEQALRFTNYHVSTTSAPTRSSIRTGRHTNRLNMFHTINGRSLLYEDEVLLPQILAQNGYVNGMFGKWHMGDNYPFRPEDRGFHEVVRHGGGGIGQGPDYWDNDYFDDTFWHNGKTEDYKGYCTDVFFDNALEFIEANKDTPFFCYIATNAPHGPLNVPAEYLEKYKNANLPENIKRFYGMITNVDDNFARLERKLEELGLRENTILIFTTDNGTAGGNTVYDAGMKGGKGSVYEGGHCVPFYIRWPQGGIAGGKDVEALVAHYDLLPTFVDLLNLDFNPPKALDGISLKPLLYGEAENWPNRVLYMDTQRELNLVKYKSYTVMDNNWRLVNGKELYDMRTDLAQKQNVIDEHPEVAERLSLGYEDWWSSIMEEGVSERYAYIKVGTEKENPVRISAHDMLNGSLSVWHQNSAITAGRASGVWKIEFIKGGTYNISLCRFPRESGLPINSIFPKTNSRIEIETHTPASTKSDFTEAFLYLANVSKKQKIAANSTEVNFTVTIPAGKYDMTAELIDKADRTFPAYYIYISSPLK